jgi:membrane protease YdiL (CAAX protease family)
MPRDAAVPHVAMSAPWAGYLRRFAVFALSTIAAVLALRLVIAPLAGRVGPVAGVPFGAFATVVVLSGSFLVGHYATFRLIDPRGWSFVGLGRDALRPGAIALGLAVGAMAIAVPSVVLLAIGWLRVLPAAPGDSLGVGARLLVLLVPAALWEELFLRGYVFALLREAWGTWRAILITSALFGLLHLQNAGADLQSVLLVTLAGIFLATVLVATRSLYAAWAAHLSWNFVMAALLHAAVSGVGLATPDYRVVDSGPDWATGGGWGPEGGLFAAAGMAVAIIFLQRRRVRRERPA